MPIEFIIPRQLSINQLQSQLREHISSRNELLKKLTHTAYDTLGWQQTKVV